jgi:hypothetical protein
MTITGPQFRAARAMLGWTVCELVRRSVVSIATINAIDETNVPSSFRKGDVGAIQAALEEGGIEFHQRRSAGCEAEGEEGQGEVMIRKRRFDH